MPLLWWVLGCALITKQADFEVDVGLIEIGELPGETVGEMDFEVKLYPETERWYIPAYIEVEDWGALLLADQLLRAKGEAGILSVEVPSLSLESDAPLELLYTISSDFDKRHFLSGAERPGELGACHITVSVDTPAEAHAADVLACVEAYADANGGPLDFFLEVEVEATEATDFVFAASYLLGTAVPVETECIGRMVVTPEMLAESDNVEIETLTLAGYAAAVDHPMSLVAFENTWRVDTEPANAAGSSSVRLQAGEGAFFGQEIEVVDSVPARVSWGGVEAIDYTPQGAAWLDASMEALEAKDGFVDACWVAAHDVTPNEAYVRFSLVGDGAYDGRDK